MGHGAVAERGQMPNTAGVPPVPLQVYLRSVFEPDAEFAEGVIEARPAPQWNHASWQGALLVFFQAQKTGCNIRVSPSLRVRTGPNTVRVPDVTILDRSLPVEQVITHPPIAVFEILSPEDTVTRMMTKLADYERMGVRTILVLDPNGKHFRYSQGALEPLPSAAFDLAGSACRFDLAEIEKLLD
jgi:Uma2 family endonuclease